MKISLVEGLGSLRPVGFLVRFPVLELRAVDFAVSSTNSGAKNILSSPLVEFINLSVQSGKYPSELKHAKIIPVYKCYDETGPSNYSPPSIEFLKKLCITD